MRIVKGFAKVIVVIMILNLVAFSVAHVLTHGKMFGKATGWVIGFATFPRQIKETFGQLSAKVKHHQLEVDHSLKYINNLNKDFYGLVSYYSDDADYLDLKLINYKTDSIVHQWKYQKENLVIEGLSTNHPVLMDDYSIIFKLEYDLYKLDANSKVIWKNDSLMFHHSSELDYEGNLWSPTTIGNGSLNLNSKLKNFGSELTFRDDAITKVDPATGKILFSKSVSEILLENNYPALVYGFWQYDPIHLNDIEPVLTDSRYWKRGDLFLSCRNIHTVFLYRPSTNKIVWLRTGLWVNQHDVDVSDSATITVFNNNVNQNFNDFVFKENKGEDSQAIKMLHDPIKLNTIVAYSFPEDSSYNVIPDFMEREKIDTRSQGIFTPLRNGLYFIEETDQGKIFIGDNDRTLLKMQFVSADSSFAYYPGWSRIYEQIPAKQRPK
ncbi:MAG: arylsulfotransferase family protein [Chryseolinea sp.]